MTVLLCGCKVLVECCVLIGAKHILKVITNTDHNKRHIAQRALWHRLRFVLRSKQPTGSSPKLLNVQLDICKLKIHLHWFKIGFKCNYKIICAQLVIINLVFFMVSKSYSIKNLHFELTAGLEPELLNHWQEVKHRFTSFGIREVFSCCHFICRACVTNMTT